MHVFTNCDRSALQINNFPSHAVDIPSVSCKLDVSGLGEVLSNAFTTNVVSSSSENPLHLPSGVPCHNLGPPFQEIHIRFYYHMFN